MTYGFEKVSRFKDVEFEMPKRKTAGSAGYDFVVAEETVIPSYNSLMAHIEYDMAFSRSDIEPEGTIFTYINNKEFKDEYYSLEDIAKVTKDNKAKPTLVSTGVKAYMPKDSYLELSVRSSCPLKYWLIMANGVGIIDSDYADNPDNEGEIFFQIINLSPVPIILHKGDVIGQGIFKPYLKTDDDNVVEERMGGFGSTNG